MNKFLNFLYRSYTCFVLKVKDFVNAIINFYKWFKGSFANSFYPGMRRYFNFWVKIFIIFFYVFLFYWYLHTQFGVNFDNITIKDFFFILKLKGYWYFFLLWLSFVSSLPWIPLKKNVFTLKNWFKFFLIFFIYHTIFVLTFIFIPLNIF